jgi:hypothetical protein
MPLRHTADRDRLPAWREDESLIGPTKRPRGRVLNATHMALCPLELISCRAIVNVWATRPFAKLSTVPKVATIYVMECLSIKYCRKHEHYLKTRAGDPGDCSLY